MNPLQSVSDRARWLDKLRATCLEVMPCVVSVDERDNSYPRNIDCHETGRAWHCSGGGRLVVHEGASAVHVHVDEGSSLELMEGAIALGVSVRGKMKAVVGPESLLYSSTIEQVNSWRCSGESSLDIGARGLWLLSDITCDNDNNIGRESLMSGMSITSTGRLCMGDQSGVFKLGVMINGNCYTSVPNTVIGNGVSMYYTGMDEDAADKLRKLLRRIPDFDTVRGSDRGAYSNLCKPNLHINADVLRIGDMARISLGRGWAIRSRVIKVGPGAWLHADSSNQDIRCHDQLSMGAGSTLVSSSKGVMTCNLSADSLPMVGCGSLTVGRKAAVMVVSDRMRIIYSPSQRLDQMASIRIADNSVGVV